MDELTFTNRESWRIWLEKNHADSDGIWMVYYKKQSKKISITYDEGVEEALCFGWIDSLVRTIDESRYKQKYTPRNPKSIWSELNKARVRRLTDEGRMTEAGLRLVEAAKKSGEWQKDRSAPRVVEMPEALQAALESNPVALENFNSFAPSYHRMYVGWVSGAKRDETRAKRIRKVVDRSEKNLKPDLNM